MLEVEAGSETLLEEVRRRGALPPLLPGLLKKRTAAKQKAIDQALAEEEIEHRYVPEGFPSSFVYNYEHEREKVEATRAARKEAQEEGATSLRDPRFPLWAHLISSFNRGTIMRVGYPLMLHAWHAHQDDLAVALLNVILTAYGEYPNRVAEAQAFWQSDVKPDTRASPSLAGEVAGDGQRAVAGVTIHRTGLIDLCRQPPGQHNDPGHVLAGVLPGNGRIYGGGNALPFWR